MVKEDLLLWPQNSPLVEHCPRSICSDNDANLTYIQIPNVALKWHDISRWDDNPHPLPRMCPPSLIQLLISGSSTSPSNHNISCSKIKA